MGFPQNRKNRMKEPQLSDLEKKIQYTFKNKNLLIEALNHSSYVNEQSDTNIRNNECLEFLGDAVLSLSVGHILMKRFPDMKEGDLSRMRARLVNESQLANIARSLDLGSHIRLGKGEIQSNGREKSSILADAYEALLAAVYLDSGFDTVFHMIQNTFSALLDSMKSPEVFNDYKSQLQEMVQVAQQEMPSYTVIDEFGPDHDKTFRVEVKVGDIRSAGMGKSKKTAEQNAAGKILKMFRKNGLSSSGNDLKGHSG
jgi:ribonuclease III